MKLPEKTELPLRAPQQDLNLDEGKVAQFHKAFASSEATYVPLTATSVMMKGVFDLVNQMQVDWKNLLHATQSYIYHSPLKGPTHLRGETKLIGCKFRAKLHWLNFETLIFRQGESEPVITCKTLLMVKEA